MMFTLIILLVLLLSISQLSNTTPSQPDCLQIINAVERFGGKCKWFN